MSTSDSENQSFFSNDFSQRSLPLPSLRLLPTLPFPTSRLNWVCARNQGAPTAHSHVLPSGSRTRLDQGQTQRWAASKLLRERILFPGSDSRHSIQLPILPWLCQSQARVCNPLGHLANACLFFSMVRTEGGECLANLEMRGLPGRLPGTPGIPSRQQAMVVYPSLTRLPPPLGADAFSCAPSQAGPRLLPFLPDHFLPPCAASPLAAAWKAGPL